MPEEQLKAFLEKVKADTSLQAKLNAASDADAVVSLAKEEGFSVSIDDLTKAQSELSDEELEGVAGGKINSAEAAVAVGVAVMGPGIVASDFTDLRDLSY